MRPTRPDRHATMPTVLRIGRRQQRRLYPNRSQSRRAGPHGPRQVRHRPLWPDAGRLGAGRRCGALRTGRDRRDPASSEVSVHRPAEPAV
jgi:hypothetical protein